MGGKAFQGLSRMTPVGYVLAAELVKTQLAKNGIISYAIPKSFNKESYGDVDVFLDCNDKTLFEQDTGLFNIIY